MTPATTHPIPDTGTGTGTGQTVPAPVPPPALDVPHPVFAYDVEDITYDYDHPTITGAQIMAAANIAESEGLIQIKADGTRETITAHSVVHLVSGAQFKRRPRFKRG